MAWVIGAHISSRRSIIEQILACFPNHEIVFHHELDPSTTRGAAEMRKTGLPAYPLGIQAFAKGCLTDSRPTDAARASFSPDREQASVLIGVSESWSGDLVRACLEAHFYACTDPRSVGWMLRAVVAMRRCGVAMLNSDAQIALLQSNHDAARHADSQALLPPSPDHAKAKQTAEAREVLESLGPQEFNVLRMLAKGTSNRDIAAAMYRSVKTVETHKQRLRHKLGAGSSLALAQMAARLFEHADLESDEDNSPLSFPRQPVSGNPAPLAHSSSAA